MKKRAFVAAVIYICFCLCVSSTFAYFTDETKTHNIITSGGIDIEIVEKTLNENGVETAFPKDGMKNIMPGSTVSKIVSVENVGSSEAWIRVKADADITSSDSEKLPTTLQDGTSVITFDVESDWIAGEDGYYYYAKTVAPGEKTAVLFSEVAFAVGMTNEYQNCTANLTVTAQAVQSANNPIPTGGSVANVLGWGSAE